MGSAMNMKRTMNVENNSKPAIQPKPRKSLIQRLISKRNDSNAKSNNKSEDMIATASNSAAGECKAGESAQPVATAKTRSDKKIMLPEKSGQKENSAMKKLDTLKDVGIEQNSKSPIDDPRTLVENSWKMIQSWKKSEESKKPNEFLLKQGFKTIRVFVSSTFTDMHNEREILVKKVFHKLRQWCEERKFNLVECDLRWGVPKETTTTTTISICLEELDRCIEENDEKPFFICTIGERYGWIPTELELNEDIKKKYDWVPNVSITHMEILHGAYRLKNPNALFCFRDASVSKDIPAKYKNKFIDEDELSVQQLKKLKEKLKCQFRDQHFDYVCQYSHLDMSTGREKVFLNIPEQFESKVFDFLTNAITKQYPDNEISAELSPEEQDDFVHNSYLYLKSNFVVGRKEEIQSIMKFIEGGFDDVSDDVELGLLTLKAQDDMDRLKSECETFKVDDCKSRLLCVVGDSGLGKCTIVSQVGRLINEQNRRFFYHNVTCSANGMSWVNVLHRLIRFLSKEYFEEIMEENSTNFEFLAELLGKSLKQVKEEVVIILYGVEKETIQSAATKAGHLFHTICESPPHIHEMENNDSTDCLAWLPPRYPGNVKVIVCIDAKHYICNDRLQCKDPYFLEIKVFSDNDAQEYVQEYLLKFNKKLDPDQMKCLLANESSRLPIWLSIVCEELRIFGDFATLSNKIKTFPSDLKDLLKEIIDRLIREDDTKLMNKLLCLLVSSHSGLPESELPKLLGDPVEGSEVPMVTWATLKSYLKPFITITSSYSGKLIKVKLSYDAFIEVLKTTLLNDETSKEWHKYLADYFEYYNNDDYFIYEDLAHNLYHAGLWKRMADFYRTNMRTFSLNNIVRSKILKPIRCRQMVPKNIPNMTIEVITCLQCSLKSKVISTSPFPLKDLCFICGSWIAFKKPENMAFVCMNHGGFNLKNKCIFCRIPVMPSPHIPINRLHICDFCLRGSFPNTCCQILDQP